MHTRLRSAAGVLLACLPIAAAGAQTHAGDVLLATDAGRIITGGVDGGAPVFPARVFSAQFGDLGFPDRTTDPGFQSIGSDAFPFPSNAVVAIAIRAAVREWDGDAFDQIPVETVSVLKDGFTIASPAADPAPGVTLPELEIGLTDPFDGGFHEHAGYLLNQPATDGLYLLELEARAPGASPSDPFWIVMSQNAAQQELEEAIAWVEQNLIDDPAACPCDWTGDESLDSGDFFAFIGDFLAGNADFDSSGTTDSGDFFGFIECFVSAC